MNDEDFEKRVTELYACFVEAISGSIKESGSQKNFAEKTGIHQSRISDYANANYDFKNITIGTLIRLFPEIQITYTTNKPQENTNEIFDVMEKRILKIFRELDIDKKVKCFEMLSRTFGERFSEEG